MRPLCVILVLVPTVAVYAVELTWHQWVTNAISLTNTQSAMLMTAAVAQWTTNLEPVWGSCWSQWLNKEQSGYYCAASIRTLIIKTAIELAALGKITEWWKRDMQGLQEPRIIGGVVFAPVTDFTTTLEKRDGSGTLQFDHGNSTFVYSARSVYNLTSGLDQLAIVEMDGHRSNISANAALPVLAVLMSSNGEWEIAPMTKDTSKVAEHDGLSSDYYVNGAGSVILECQYGGGVTAAEFEDQLGIYDDVLGLEEDCLTQLQYNALPGYNSSDSPVKCAYKVYN
ncbi:hypothetical protein KAFR_0D03770 [Kazachstania africana CBS 2517]|uniref:Uncharacterized protein n=1 Tax=Kazachstania africana (strain ATCC 22294 / BCRC 22015 / CBS 2517 / CECT 1963 / NBRC 1671 / NRRL Y-8276) TaxID=1071382 RepID=H2AUH5_KAZAF|nr:hypothetical protein KAFR_0D03770 [Kazachstania africana CBS 2517]CCF58025.1 hypothetical protein KAFR_0D03770 [Kazachstania africana CBS 2517]